MTRHNYFLGKVSKKLVLLQKGAAIKIQMLSEFENETSSMKDSILKYKSEKEIGKNTLYFL